MTPERRKFLAMREIPLPVEEAAKKLGISKRTAWRWEKERREAALTADSCQAPPAQSPVQPAPAPAAAPSLPFLGALAAKGEADREEDDAPVDADALATRVRKGAAKAVTVLLDTASGRAGATPAGQERAAGKLVELAAKLPPPKPRPGPEDKPADWSRLRPAELDAADHLERVLRGEPPADNAPIILPRAPARWGLDTRETRELERLLGKVRLT